MGLASIVPLQYTHRTPSCSDLRLPGGGSCRVGDVIYITEADPGLGTYNGFEIYGFAVSSAPIEAEKKNCC